MNEKTEENLEESSDILKTGHYKKNPIILDLEHTDLIKYFHINDIKNAFTKNKKLKITDKGIYSISKPYLTQWICSIIINNIGYSKEYIKKNIILTDGTAGIGGDVIFFSKYFKQINAVELNPVHFNVLKHNINEVLNIENVNFYLNNYINVSTILKNDIVYLDPPWGGKNVYKKKDIMLSLGNYKIYNIINKLYEYSVKFVFLKIPHNFNYYLFFHRVKYDEIRIFKNHKVWLLMMKLS